MRTVTFRPDEFFPSCMASLRHELGSQWVAIAFPAQTHESGLITGKIIANDPMEAAVFSAVRAFHEKHPDVRVRILHTEMELMPPRTER